MQPKTKAIILGLLLAAVAPLVLVALPEKPIEAFSCFGDHLKHIWASVTGAGGAGHPWSAFLWPWLCLWVVSLALTLVAGLGLAGLWARAERRHRSSQWDSRTRPQRQNLPAEASTPQKPARGFARTGPFSLSGTDKR